jgi:Zn-finger nucleic acid-binding protein
MAVIRFACPECQSVLKSGNPIALGTKIKCPKCSHVFALTPEVKEAALEAEAVGAPSSKRGAPEEYAEFDDTEDTDEYEDEYEEKPRPKFKKKKRKTAGNKTLILALSIGGLVLLVAGGGLAAFFWLRGPNYQEPLAFVPSNSTIIMTLDVESFMDQLGLTSQQFEKFLKAGGPSDPNFAKCKEETDLELKELFNQVTLAFANPMQQVFSGQGRGNAQAKLAFVIKTALSEKT